MKQKNTPLQKPSLFFVNKDKEALFSKKNRALLSDPMDDNNPITVQVLGICSALAITVQLKASHRNEYFCFSCYGSFKRNHFLIA